MDCKKKKKSGQRYLNAIIWQTLSVNRTLVNSLTATSTPLHNAACTTAEQYQSKGGKKKEEEAKSKQTRQSEIERENVVFQKLAIYHSEV